jgi:hypothetical protein
MRINALLLCIWSIKSSRQSYDVIPKRYQRHPKTLITSSKSINNVIPDLIRDPVPGQQG